MCPLTPDERRLLLERYRARAAAFDETAGRHRRRYGDALPHLSRSPLPNPEPVVRNREIRVLALIAEGLSNEEIGSVLYISTETVKNHVRGVLAKLEARNRAHAVACGVRKGLLDLELPPHS